MKNNKKINVFDTLRQDINIFMTDALAFPPFWSLTCAFPPRSEYTPNRASLCIHRWLDKDRPPDTPMLGGLNIAVEILFPLNTALGYYGGEIPPFPRRRARDIGWSIPRTGPPKPIPTSTPKSASSQCSPSSWRRFSPRTFRGRLTSARSSHCKKTIT